MVFDLLPGGLPGALWTLTPLHELTYGLPKGGTAHGDKAYNAATDAATILADNGVRLIPIRRANMAPNAWADKLVLRILPVD